MTSMEMEVFLPFDAALRVEWTKIDMGYTECFVKEATSIERGYVKFGPMSRDLTGPFIAERRRYWEWMVNKEQNMICLTGGCGLDKSWKI